MTPLPQLGHPLSHRRVPLRIRFRLLFILFLLSELILPLTFMSPEVDRSPLLVGEKLIGLNCFTFVGGSQYQPASKKKALPFIPHLEGKKAHSLPEKETRDRPKIALIIDDVGFVRQPTEDFWALDIPLTFAVLPWGKYSELHAKQALQRNQQIILHLPLEPLDSSINPGAGAIFESFSPQEALQQLRKNLAAVPGVIGVNNHMGSKGTQDLKMMTLIMTELKMRGLFFIDSMTIKSSLAWKVAQKMQVPVGIRNVFLDGLGIEGIPLQVRVLIEKALNQGSAIGIAHTRPGVAKAISDCLPLFQQAQIELVHVSQLVK
ncbi:MAG TPA: hypothetical protein DDW93_10095 [Firmicutes bacterium]|nr:hypothetical protein [Bacillota bacterium]HBK68136.1 hypothetical protein [Bacillota bacterium]HBT17578.1 hypothetical protein [Bacillota bacterium]